MKLHNVLVNLSVLSISAAFALMFYALLGAYFAPTGHPGAFDFFTWPAVGCAGIAIGLLIAGRRLAPHDEASMLNSCEK